MEPAAWPPTSDRAPRQFPAMPAPRVSPNERETGAVSKDRDIQDLIQLNMKTNGKKSSPALAKGQLWSTAKGHIQIVELGKMLVHYKMLRDLRQMRRTQMSRIDNHGSVT